MFKRFTDDLRGAVATIGAEPILAAVTVGLALVAALTGGLLFPISFAVSLFATGWAGTQQLWAARHEHGEPNDASDIWSTTWRYLGRFFVLGLFYIPVLVVTFYALARNDAFDRPHHAVTLSWSARAFSALILIGIEVVLTFVFPALALTTRRVSEAASLGWRLLRENWRRDIWYAVAPAVTLQSAYAFVAPAARRGQIGGAVIGAVLALVALLFRIAIVREYVRLQAVDGRQPL